MGGGLVGSGSSGVTVYNSYSTGNIGSQGGGLVGANSNSANVLNSYSTGAIGPSGGGLFGASPLGQFDSNSDFANGAGWSDTTAKSRLMGSPSGSNSLGTTWGTCGINLPFFLTSFYTRNPCESALPINVEVTGSTPVFVLSQTSVAEPTNNSFSVTSKLTSDPFSFVSLVNGSGSVSLDGTTCTQTTSCQIQDVTQGSFSRGSFVINSDGTVVVRRYNSITGSLITVGTLTLTRVRVAVPEVARNTVVLNSNGGACGVSSVTVTHGSSIDLPTSESCAKAGHTFAGWLDENGSRVLTKELVVTGDRTLSASWIVEVAKPSVLVRNRITARISRLASDAQVVRVRGQVVGATKSSDLQVWFKEKGMKAFVKSSEPVVRKGRQFTWFHYTGNAIRVYVVANGAEQSRTLRISGLPNGG